MFGWFQRLLPQRGDFFGMFEAHAATLVEAAKALQELASNLIGAICAHVEDLSVWK